MRRKALLGALILPALLAYATASLWWGVAGWQTRGSTGNGASLLPDGGGVGFSSPGIAFAKESQAWVEAARRSHRLELSLSVRPFLSEQKGPARIFTLSSGPYARNLTIAQQGADLVLRLRTAWTSSNGMLGNKSVARMTGVFLAEDWVDIELLIEAGRLRMTLGNELLIDEALPAHPFETWDSSHRLALGNEFGGTRPWLGEIRRAVVRTEGHFKNYAETGELDVPPQFLIEGPPPKLVPFVDLNWKDAINNVALYVPLGILLGFFLGAGAVTWRWRAVLGAWLFVALVSVSMELLQFLFVPGRWPSVDDVVFNTIGGGLGLLPAFYAARHCATNPPMA